MPKRKRPRLTLDEIAANVDAFLNAEPKRNKDGSIKKTPGRKPKLTEWEKNRLAELQKIDPGITNPYYIPGDPMEAFGEAMKKVTEKKEGAKS